MFISRNIVDFYNINLHYFKFSILYRKTIVYVFVDSYVIELNSYRQVSIRKGGKVCGRKSLLTVTTY